MNIRSKRDWSAPSFDMQTMKGKTFTRVAKLDLDILSFTEENGTQYVFHHHQDCCENVYIEDIVGDLSDLEGTPLLEAEEVITRSENADYETKTHTFYKFGTIKGHVNVRWYGASNGYYSESVDRTVLTNV